MGAAAAVAYCLAVDDLEADGSRTADRADVLATVMAEPKPRTAGHRNLRGILVSRSYKLV